jgi:glutamate synthase domain-containing protein 3
MRLILTGEANDYVGKSMTGGEIVVRPFPQSPFVAHENAIIGNTVMYGATGGSLYAAGRAGERFAVRNSGGHAVIEGIGDHGCEYMTGGTVVVLGETGRNFAAGMTGGVAYVIDEDGEFPTHCNQQLVDLERVSDEDAETLHAMILRHYKLTESQRASAILDRWETYSMLFWKVMPKSSEEKPATLSSAKRETIVDLNSTDIPPIPPDQLVS